MRSDTELIWLAFLCKGKGKNIQNIFTDSQVNSYLSRYPDKPKEYICNYLETTNDTISTFKEKVLKVICVNTCTNSSQVKELF